jgi:hypothetical protein
VICFLSGTKPLSLRQQGTFLLYVGSFFALLGEKRTNGGIWFFHPLSLVLSLYERQNERQQNGKYRCENDP